MSIYAYSGLMGSGKSYSVVQNIILPACEKGTPIYTNLRLNLELLRKDFIHSSITYIKGFAYQDFLKCPAGHLMIIDEAQNILPASITASNWDNELKTLINEHRHMVDAGRSVNIVLLTPVISQLSPPIRALIDTEYRVMKLDALGIKSRYRVSVFKNGVSDKTASYMGKYKKKVYRYYSSHTKAKSDNVVNVQEQQEGQRPFIKSAPFFGVLVALLGLGYFFFDYQALLFGSEVEAQAEIVANDNTVLEVLDSQFDDEEQAQSVPVPMFSSFRYVGRFPIEDVYQFIVSSSAGDFILSHHDLIKLGHTFEVLRRDLFLVSGSLVGSHTRAEQPVNEIDLLTKSISDPVPI